MLAPPVRTRWHKACCNTCNGIDHITLYAHSAASADKRRLLEQQDDEWQINLHPLGSHGGLAKAVQKGMQAVHPLGSVCAPIRHRTLSPDNAAATMLTSTATPVQVVAKVLCTMFRIVMQSLVTYAGPELCHRFGDVPSQGGLI